jgi:hypothetical protein
LIKKSRSPPWKLLAVQGLVYVTPPPETHFDPAHVERDFLALMERQRNGCTGVGGFCQVTTLTEHAVTQKILKRWPISAEEIERYEEAIASVRQSRDEAVNCP